MEEFKEGSFKILPIKDPERVEIKKKTDEFKKLLVNLRKEIEKIENDETRSKISRYLEPLEKINDRELKGSLFITEGIIDIVKELIEKYEAQDDLDKETKRISLIKIKNIKDYCEECIRQT